ncbi:hypothetical protein ACVWY2_008743 [Bradyrhizobium sp. JR6.1]
MCKATVHKVLNASWQRCRVHFMRNALAHAGKSGRRVVSAFIATAFAQDDAEAARAQWRKVADQLRPIGGLLHERAQVHHLIGHRWFLGCVGVSQPDPTGESPVTTAKPPARYGAI